MKWIFVLVATFAQLSAANTSGKIYVTPDQVHISSEGILVNLQGNLLTVNGLFRDTQGLHIMSQEVIDDRTFSWTCPYGHSSPNGTGMCRHPGCPFEKK